MRHHDFEYSVFGYAFRKSLVETGSTFDHVILSIEDAEAYDTVPETDYRLALACFGDRTAIPVREFPGGSGIEYTL